MALINDVYDSIEGMQRAAKQRKKVQQKKEAAAAEAKRKQASKSDPKDDLLFK